MPMRVGGDCPALFCVHPLIGLSWCYLPLLPHVDASYPLYGLQARGVRRPEPLPVTMAEMAQDYADLIRKVQPAGPYHLLGWSLGGNIAFAIAEELQRRGEQTGLLVILDADLANLDAIAVSDEALTFCNMILAQFGYVPALTPADPDPKRGYSEHQQSAGAGAETGNWRSFVDGPIESVELDCDHRLMLLPEPVARIGPTLTERLARAAAMPVREGSGSRTP